MSYVSFDMAIHLVLKAGIGVLLAMSDTESALHLLPVHPFFPFSGLPT